MAATLAEAGLAADADPDSRLSGGRSLSDSQLESMLGALGPLPVRVDEDQDEDRARDADLVVRGTLGKGGMGVVELAYQKTLDREVALKRLREHPGPGSAPQVFSLLDEARIGGRLAHPNIVPVHAIGRDPRLGPVVLFKRVQGQTWSEAIAKDRDALPGDPDVLEKHLRVLLQVGNALRFAHSLGILHRDVKPDNVMLGPFGEVYLLDWGLAFEVGSATDDERAIVAGTATYMAPEMARGELSELTPQTDVYLLGATLHYLLTGRPRHRGDGLGATLLQALLSPPYEYDDEVAPELGAIANRACAAEPALRFASVEEMQDAIERFLSRREARILVASARELLAPIDADDASEGSTEHGARDHADVLRRFQEARFALSQALRLHPDFGPAARALREAQLLELRYAIARGDVSRALATVEEMAEPPPKELVDILEALRRARREKRERVAALERDVDTGVARPDRIRTMAIAFLALTAMHVIGWLRHPGSGEALPPLSLLQEGAVFAGAVLLGLLVARQRLARTKLNRQFLRAGFAVASTILLIRAVGLLLELPAPSTLAIELLALGAILIAIETPVRPLPIAGAVVMVAGLGAAWRPSFARFVYIGVTELLVLGLLVQLVLEGKRHVRAGSAE